MLRAASALACSVPLLAALVTAPGCRSVFAPDSPPGSSASQPVLGAGALLPSPRLIVGRIVAVDGPQRFAFVEVATDAPNAALSTGTELMVRTLELQPTGKLEVSRYLRGRTLGTKIVAGQPSPGDEVVWLAP